MTDPYKTVLFMDDELGSAPIVDYAVAALRDAGFEVTEVSRMSEAMDAFYNSFYHVFVLDIDMSCVEDVQEGDGTDVARFLRALDSGSHVINFSARGLVPNWFAAANYHLYGYIHKGEDGAVQRLVELVRTASRELVEQPMPLSRPRPPEKVLVAVEPPCTVVPADELAELAERALEGWEVIRASGLADAVKVLESDPGRWGLVAVTSDEFDNRPGTRELFQRLCAFRGRPQAVLGCRGEQGAWPSILSMVNARPFRLVDLADREARSEIGLALRSAADHYGRQEILEPDAGGLRRLRLEMSQQVHDDMGFEQETDLLEDEDLDERPDLDDEQPRSWSHPDGEGGGK